MSGPRRGGRHRKDENHDLVVEAIERLGYWWWDASQSDLGIDGFACGFGRLVPVEIKDPQSRRGLALSPREQIIHTVLARHGIRVELVTGPGASLEPLVPPRRNFYDPRRNT